MANGLENERWRPGQLLPDWARRLMQGSWWLCPVGWVGFVRIEPTAVEELLTRNRKNRLPVGSQVALIASAVRRGQWKVTGETIIWDWHERLLNGQHRLMGCAKAGIPIETFTVFGMDPDAFKVLDQQTKRTLSQVLGMMGQAHPRTLATALVMLANFHATGKPLGGKSSYGGFTIDDLLAGLDLYPGLRESVDFAHALNRRSPEGEDFTCDFFRGPSLVACLHWIFGRVDAAAATQFFRKICQQAVGDSASDQPLRKLMSSLRWNLSGPPSEAAEEEKWNRGGRRLGRLYTECYTIKAWNAFLKGETITQMRWNLRTGEGFPEVQGWKYGEGKPSPPRAGQTGGAA